MFARIPTPDEKPVPLSIVAGHRIVLPGLEPLTGWIGEENPRPDQPLTFPRWLLEPRATETIVYACNLPATAASLLAPGAPASPGSEHALLAASLPGGRSPVYLSGGKPGAMLFRWLLTGANRSRGPVWQCYARLCADTSASPWTQVGLDYAFDAEGGFPLDAPGTVRVAVGGTSFRIAFPDRKLTSFAAQSGLVKVTRIEADGWAKRELISLWLYPDRRIVARFSDGAAMRIATAAPARAAFMAA
jgi:hypothetical protein